MELLAEKEIAQSDREAGDENLAFPNDNGNSLLMLEINPEEHPSANCKISF